MISPRSPISPHIVTAAAAALILGAGSIAAQEVPFPSVEADTARWRVEGRVLRPGTAEPRPVAGIWVVLHRVGPDVQGPVDSTRSRADGSFRIEYRRSSAETAIYFVSADYAGIAYFSGPLREPVVRGEAADLYVFDTTSAPVPVRVLGRHLVVSAARVDGHREIVEAYELANDTIVTRVSAGTRAPVFTAIIPDRATAFQPGQGDFSPGALLMEEGRLISHAPIPPGLKQISFSYTLPAEAFPLSVPLDHPVEVMEVLMEEPVADARGAGLVEVSPVSIERRTFRRFLGQQLAANSVISVTVPALPTRPLGPAYAITIAIVAGGVLAVGLLAAFMASRRRVALRSVAPPAPLPQADEDAAALARAVAELDESFEARSNPTDTDRESYQARRDELKSRLADVLAARRGAG